MKLLSAAAVISSFYSILVAAPQSAKIGESSIVDRNNGIALKLNIHPPTEESGNRSLLISIDLSNEGPDVWSWTGERRLKVGNVPQLREIFSVTLRDQRGNECELTADGEKLLCWQEDKNSNEGKARGILNLNQLSRKDRDSLDLMNHSHKYLLKGGDSFHWQVDLLKCFKVQGGKYDVTIKANWQNGIINGGRWIPTTDNPDVRIAGKRVTVPGQTTANKAQK